MTQVPAVLQRYVLMNLEDHLIKEAREEWSWLVPASWEVLMITKMGDWFFCDQEGTVFFLDLIDGALTALRFTRDEVMSDPDMDVLDEVFSVKMIDSLLSKGYWLEPDACFCYKLLPIVGGSLDEDNIKVGFFSIYQSVQAQFHQQLHDKPPGYRISGFRLEGE